MAAICHTHEQENNLNDSAASDLNQLKVIALAVL